MDNGASSYRRFLDGDDKGLAEIVRDYKDGLILYINSFVDNIYIAEELMEQTLFKLITKKPRYSEKNSFKTWLYTIGRNVAIDYIRHNSRISNIPIDDMENYMSDEADLEKSYIIEERKIIVHKALRNLHPEYRQVLWLIYFEDFEYTHVESNCTNGEMWNLEAEGQPRGTSMRFEKGKNVYWTPSEAVIEKIPQKSEVTLTIYNDKTKLHKCTVIFECISRDLGTAEFEIYFKDADGLNMVESDGKMMLVENSSISNVGGVDSINDTNPYLPNIFCHYVYLLPLL